MSTFLAFPPVAALRGTLRVSPSKSASNRALLLAALTASPVEIVRPLESEDIGVLRRCLVAMGASIEATAEGLRVSGPLRGPTGSAVTLDAGDSGTAARFLIAVCSAVPGRFHLTGSRRLCERPMGGLIEALRCAGASIRPASAPGRLPLVIEGGTVRSGPIAVDAAVSSQFLSALLLAAVAVEGGLRVQPSGRVVSAPYVEMTLEALRDFGHEVAQEAAASRVRRGSNVAARFVVPGDYSSALPLMAAAGAASGEIALLGLRWPSRDADAGALAVLERMGLRIAALPERIDVAGPTGAPRPVEVDANAFPDAVPALAALAALAPGPSRFSNIEHLREKESDRLAGLVEILTAVGASAVAEGGALTVTGPPRAPASGPVRLSTFQDHRLAMAAAILSLRIPELLIENPDCVGKSYPGFFRDLESLSIR